MITLFPDQQESLDKLRESMKKHKSVLLQGSTGSGKSIMACDVIMRAGAKQATTWFVVPRKDLLFQMSEHYQEFDISHSFIAAGRAYNPFAQHYICSTDTITGRLGKLRPPKLAVIDEGHYGGAGLDRIIKWLKASGSYIILLSATPWKLSGMGLGCWCDDMVIGPSVRWLIDNKRLSDYRPFAPDSPDLSRLKITAGEFAKGQLSEFMEGNKVLIGNAVKHYQKHGEGRLGVTFAVSRKHSELLAQSYRDAGIPAMHIDGDTPMDERRRIARAFAKREILQLCNAELLTFGYDLAAASGIKGVNIQCITDCQPTKSLAKQMQKNGRGLRYDGDRHLFFDHANNFNEHGLPCDPREWTLSDREKRKGGSGEITMPIRQCVPMGDDPTGCYHCHRPAPVCPNCGRVYPVMSREIEEVDGELVEISAEAKRDAATAQQERRKKEKQEVGRAKTFEELKAIQVARKYHPGWVFNQMRIKGIKA